MPASTTSEWTGGEDEADDDADETAFNFCEFWDPDANITYNMGVYNVDAAWFANVVADPRPLVHCDDAEVTFQSILGGGPGYKVSNASSQEMLYELGLRNNEIVTTINGNSVASFDDAAELLYDLYYDQGETSYSVAITCVSGCSGTGRSYPTTLDYELIN